MEIGYHVWKVQTPERVLRMLGFEERDGYWDKTVQSQMSSDYIKIYRDIS